MLLKLVVLLSAVMILGWGDISMAESLDVNL